MPKAVVKLCASMPIDPDQAGSNLLPDVAAAIRRRGAGFAPLFLAFNLSFILSPYWLLPAFAEGWLRTALLIFLIAAGTTWAWLGSGAVAFGAFRRPVWLLLVSVPLVALNARALGAGIPWRGDEGFHFGGTAALFLHLHQKSLAPVEALMIASVFGFVWAARRLDSFGLRAAAICAGFIAVEIFVVEILRHHLGDSLQYPYNRLGGRTSILPDRTFEDYNLLRYPYVVRWLSAIPLLLLSPFIHLTLPFTGHGEEVAYRLVPLFSALLIAWAVWLGMANKAAWMRWLMAMAVGTTPLLVYYTSTLYLELPAVLLMTIALLDIERLLVSPPRQLGSIPAWYALIMVGFVKETTFPFLLTFVACRLLGRARAIKSWREVGAEMAVMVAALFPWALYVFFRDIWAESNPYVPEFARLWDAKNYRALFHSYAGQFGPLAVLACGGIIYLMLNRRYLVVLFLVGAFVGDALVHLVDQVHLVGYSRFNLFLLPVVTMAATYAIDLISRRQAAVAALLAAGVISANLWISPLHADGTKVGGWGDYGFDESEHDYPYREAVGWLAVHHARDRILVTGMDYNLELYFYRPDSMHITLMTLPYNRVDSIAPHDDPRAVASDLAGAAREGFDVVVYHVWGADSSAMPQPPGWRLARVISNQSNCLVVYERSPDQAGGSDDGSMAGAPVGQPGYAH
jgi:hypothetical protein